MSKTPAKAKRNDAAALLELLKTVLPKAATLFLVALVATTLFTIISYVRK